ncbi:unnamed protein product [Musa hybrid cultivar]
MANVSAVQLLQAAKYVLSIGAGGFLLVCQRPMDFPNFLSKGSLFIANGKKCHTLYMLQAKAYGEQLNATEKDFSMELWHRRLGHMSEKGLQALSKREVLPYLIGIHLNPCIDCLAATTVDGFRSGFRSTTRGILLVCQRPTDFRSFVAAMYLMMTLGFLLLYLTLARPHLGSTTAMTAADDSCVPTEQLLKVAKFVLAIATGGFLLVCQSPMDYPSYAMTMYLLMTLGFPSAQPFHVSFTDGTDNDLRWFPMSQQLLFLHALLFPLTPSVIDE